MKKNQLVATCCSFKCTGILSTQLKNKDFKIKSVGFSTVMCPDCNNALIWKIPRRNARVLDIKQKKNYLNEHKLTT